MFVSGTKTLADADINQEVAQEHRDAKVTISQREQQWFSEHY